MDVANLDAVSNDKVGIFLVLVKLRSITGIMDAAYIGLSQRLEKSNNGALLVPVLVRKAFHTTATDFPVAFKVCQTDIQPVTGPVGNNGGVDLIPVIPLGPDPPMRVYVAILKLRVRAQSFQHVGGFR